MTVKLFNNDLILIPLRLKFMGLSSIMWVTLSYFNKWNEVFIELANDELLFSETRARRSCFVQSLEDLS